MNHTVPNREGCPATPVRDVLQEHSANCRRESCPAPEGGREVRPTGSQKPTDDEVAQAGSAATGRSGSSGAISCSPLLRTLLTSVETLCMVSNVSDAGTSMASKASVSVSVGLSHFCQRLCGRITGMRSCTGSIVLFADVVMTVHVCNHGVPSGESFGRQALHMPATASGSPSARWMNIGCLIGLPFGPTGPCGWAAC